MIRRQICAVEMPESIGSRLSVSIGAVQNENEKVSEAVSRADYYMYQAKAYKNAIVTEWGTIDMDDGLSRVGTRKNAKRNILIVDDSMMNREILCEMLEDQFEIVEAQNGKEAVEVLEQYGRDISLVLLDIVMPVMDGFEVLQYMNEKEIIEEIPVIMISSEDSTSFIRRAYEMGVSDYISRPYDAKVVYKRVFNTIKLYAKQRRLISILTEQICLKQESRQIMVAILSHIVEFRNGESGPHVQHINMLTQSLLEKLMKHTEVYALTWIERDLIVMASSLHDIGKIGIDERILNKNGRLTQEEYEIMKQHTVLGTQILEGLQYYQDEPLVKTAREICRWHHERYDGSGYPDGLKGDEIPISAQVVALADVYDALVSKRAYKEKYTHEEAMQMILDGKCGVFNPLLLECLKEIAPEIRNEIYEEEIAVKLASE
ncbi:MAG: response regulator [Lachnospiraceae bacterium]|nr:response regulator [Lachnospiraceae bacterium]